MFKEDYIFEYVCIEDSNVDFYIKKGFNYPSFKNKYVFITGDTVLERELKPVSENEINQLITEEKINALIFDVGTIGMSGAGLVGIILESGKMLIFGGYNAENSLFLDSRPFTCEMRDIQKKNPWYYGNETYGKHHKQRTHSTKKLLGEYLSGMTICDISITDILKIKLLDMDGYAHFITCYGNLEQRRIYLIDEKSDIFL